MRGEEEEGDGEEEEKANPLTTLSRFSQTEEMRNRFAWPFHSVAKTRGGQKGAYQSPPWEQDTAFEFMSVFN